MTDLSLDVQPGQITGSMSPIPGGGGGFNPGMLQDLLRWKMGMAEKMRRDELMKQRFAMNQSREQALNERNQMNWQRRMAEDASEQGGRGLNPAAEKWAIANTASGYGQDFDRMRREQALQFIGAGGQGGGATGGGQMFTDVNRNPGAMVQQQRILDFMNQQGKLNQKYGGAEGAGTSRETGGGIPEDGWYYLHENENVVPSKKTVKEILMGNFTPDPKAPPRRSYETGTPGGRSMIRPGSVADLLFGWMGQGGGGYAEAQGLAPLRPPESLEESIPGAPEAPPTPEGDFRETMGNVDNYSWQNVGNPDVAPPEALTTLHEAQSRLGTRGGGSSGPWGTDISGRVGATNSSVREGRGAAGERSFKVEGSPETADEKAQRELDAEVAELDRMGEAASSHARMAEQLLGYASKRPNSPAYEKLREMAGDRLKMAQEMERVRNVRRASLDARQEALGQSQAFQVGRQLEAQGRVGAAQTEAQGRVAAAGTDAQSKLMQTIGELAKAYGGIEDADPEAQQQMLGQLIQQFMMMGGMAEVLGGGGFPNS